MNDEKENSVKYENESKKYLVIAWVFVFLGFLPVFYGLKYCLVAEFGTCSLNEFGDFIGGVSGALWALAGLFFIYVAFLGQRSQLVLQKEEIRLSIEEVRASRIELEGQKKALNDQNQSLRIQRFENEYFSLLSNLNNIINSIDLYNGAKGYVSATGRDVLRIYFARLKKDVRNVDNLNVISRRYQEFYNKYQGDIQPYLNNIKFILSKIDRTSFIDQAEFSEHLLCQLTNDEQAIILFHALSGFDMEFHRLVSKYGLTGNMPINYTGNTKHIIMFYEYEKYDIPFEEE